MLTSFDEKIMPYITVLQKQKFGLRHSTATISEVPKTKELLFATGINSFLFSMPWGQNMIRWQFIFDLDDMNNPPDIISHDGFYEKISPDTVYHQVPCLQQWDPTNPNCVLQLVLQMLGLFKYQQIEVLCEIPNFGKYKSEYYDLVQIINSDDVEVSIENDLRSPIVEFTIGFQLDVSGLPINIPSTQIYMAWCTVSYQHGSRPIYNLEVFEQLERLIGNTTLSTILDSSHSLTECAATVHKTLKSKILVVRKQLVARQQLINAILSKEGLQFLELDQDLFSKVCFSLTNTKHVICLVDIPNEYPVVMPNLTIVKRGKRMNIVDFCKLNINHNHSEVASKIVEECMKYADIIPMADV